MFKERFSYLLQNRNVSSYKLTKDTGISNGLISNWVHGNKTPSSENLIKLADYFDVSVDYLLGRTENLTVITPQDDVISKIEKGQKKMGKRIVSIENIRIGLKCCISRDCSESKLKDISERTGISEERLAGFKALIAHTSTDEILYPTADEFQILVIATKDINENNVDAKPKIQLQKLLDDEEKILHKRTEQAKPSFNEAKEA